MRLDLRTLFDLFPKPTQTPGPPIRLPLEVLEVIINLALASSCPLPPPTNPRISFLLRIGLVCRWLHRWSEDMLFDAVISAEGVEGINLLARRLEHQPEKAARVKELSLFLEEVGSSAAGRAEQRKQDEALAILFKCCVEVRLLRLNSVGEVWSACTFNSVDFLAIAKMPKLETLHVINITLRALPLPSWTHQFAFVRKHLPALAGAHPAPAFDTLILQDAKYAPKLLLAQLRRLSISDSSIALKSDFDISPNLRMLRLRRRVSSPVPYQLPQFRNRSTLRGLDIAATALVHNLHNISPSVEQLRVMVDCDLNRILAVITHSLSTQHASFQSIRRLVFALEGEEAVGWRVSLITQSRKVELERLAESRGISVVWEGAEGNEEDEVSFWDMGLKL